MGRIFNMDSPFMVFLGRMSDLIVLNLLAFVMCIPIVTVGASMTGLYYVTLKMVKNEEGYLVRGFFKSFKENFRQATCIWLIFLVFAIILGMDFYMFRNLTQVEFPKIVQILVGVVLFFYLMTLLYVFPVLSRFENSVLNTIKNSFLMSLLGLPKTLLILLIHAAMLLPFFAPRFMPVVLLFGLSGPAYLASMLHKGTFKKFEPQEEAAPDGADADPDAIKWPEEDQ